MLRFFALLITSFLFVQLNNSCWAQDVNKIIKKGIEELELKHDIIAYNYFLDALYIEPENAKAKLYTGICHLHLQSPKKALEYLLAVKNSKEANQLVEFPAYLAMAYHLNLDFNHAEEILNNIKDSIPTGHVDVELIKNNIQSAAASYTATQKHTVINMGNGINTRQHEYGTAAFSDHQTILYTSRPDLWNQDTLKNKRKLYENVFLVELDSNFNWKEPDFFTNPHLKGNDAVIQVFENDKKLLTYHNGDLFISNKKEDYWKKGEPIKEINTPANESHGFISKDGIWSEPKEMVGLNTPYDEDAPFLSEDGYFYFSSKGHNSIGNYDVFRTKFDEESQTWEKPENMGVPINSVFDDLYYTTYGRLAYFSSLRPGGNGGMDIYRVMPFNEIEVSGKIYKKGTDEILANSSQKLQFGEKSFIVNTDNQGNYTLNVPISTSRNFYITKNEAQEKVIVFHFGDSNSDQKKINVPLEVYSSDIPKFVLDTSPDGNIDEEEQILARQDSSINELKSDSELISENVIEEKSKNSLSAEGKNTVINQQESTAIVSEELVNKNLEPQISEQPKVEGISLNREKQVSTISKQSSTTISRIRSGKSANLYLYFDFGAAIINEVFYEGLDEIANFLKTDKNITIEVGGHTDNIGSETYNIKLSERRAKAVALYLIEKGIDKSRVLAKGYGEEIPIASNDDEKEGRELNRRVEIKKISPEQYSSISE